MRSRTALVTGVTGQDGSYLAELLLEKGYRVFGVVRRLSTPNLTHLDRVRDQVELVDADLMDQGSLNDAVRRAAPDEVYNLAAQSFVATSFAQPVLTGEVTAIGALRLLEAIRSHAPAASCYHASSSEMFGRVDTEPQSETTLFHPRSPYGVAKVYAYWACVNYREAYGLKVSNGILFNHESPRRGIEFVTRKIAAAVARIAYGSKEKLKLGNLDARRDWGYAPEYVDLIWRIVQHPTPDDYVGATGESHTVREFVSEAFRVAGIDDWTSYVDDDSRMYRPSEVFNLRGDASKAKRVLGWSPQTKFPELVKIMVQAELMRQARKP